MIILLRHATDAEAESTYAHDAKLRNSGKRNSYKKAIYLVKKYGFPTKIYISPFQRSRETAIYFAKALKKINPHKRVDFRIDPKLSRYFTKKDQQNPEMRDRTKKYNPPVYEDIDDLLMRIKKHIDSMHEKGYYHRDSEVVWAISHGLFIKKLLLSIELESPESVPFLEHYCLYLDENNNKIRLMN